LKILFPLLLLVLVVSIALPVYGQTAKIPETFQGTSSSGSMQSFSFLEWRLNYQDGTESGTTEFITTSFRTFPLSFVDPNERLRTLINAEVRTITSFSGIGSNFCFDLPRQTYTVQTLVNGVDHGIIKQLFGSNEFNQNTAINRGFGVKFTPQLVERLLDQKGVQLQTGDVITWKVTSQNRYTLYTGQTDGMGSCDAQRGTAWDGYATGMGFEQSFIWVDPVDLITVPTTGLPDLDGDGIPDINDFCDFTPERFNGFEDTDGCPDDDPEFFDPSSIVDQDGDGILDVDDSCPNVPELFNGIQDGDGCPDGATLESGFQAIPVDEPLVDLTPQPVPTPLEEILGISLPVEMQTETEPIEIEQIEDVEFVVELPETNFQVPERISDVPELTTGTSEICDRRVSDCDQVIAIAIQESTGIMVPFELSILNIMFILLGLVVAIVVIMLIIRRRK